MTKAFSFFPGCSFHSTGISYAESTQYVTGCLDIALYEIKDWNCCGASAAPTVNDDLMYSLSTRNLALSEDQHPYLQIMTPCSGCYAALKRAEVKTKNDASYRTHINNIIEMNYRGTVEVTNLLDAFTTPEMINDIVNHLKLQLGGMKVACYYGCAQVRPQEITQAPNAENPMNMEQLLNAAGAECIDWSYKTECCGASNHVVRPKAARNAAERIFHNAQINGAECIVTACPLCWMNLDMREEKINQEHKTNYHMPIYFFTELIAMALGANPEQAGITRHFVPAVDLVTQKLGPIVPKEEPETPEEAKARRIREALERKAVRDKEKAATAKIAKTTESKTTESKSTESTATVEANKPTELTELKDSGSNKGGGIHE